MFFVLCLYLHVASTMRELTAFLPNLQVLTPMTAVAQLCRSNRTDICAHLFSGATPSNPAAEQCGLLLPWAVHGWRVGLGMGRLGSEFGPALLHKTGRTEW